MKSLKAREHPLADPGFQLEILEREKSAPTFGEHLAGCGLYPLRPAQLEIFQVNIGKMCNQTCRHCHVDAGPDRKEIMTRETMELCLQVLRAHPNFQLVDLTGGAPEMNPQFRWFVEEVSKLERKVMVRCNLTILLANKKYFDLPQFYREHRVEVVSSLPFYSRERTDRQRGDGVFEDSIRALQRLNEVGYGQADSGLQLHLVYNPAGAFLPASQEALERDFKDVLYNEWGIVFNRLFTIANMPISRYLDYLLASGNYESYMNKLIQAFNPAAAMQVMCRNTLSVGWDGILYDCDFNQMLGLVVEGPSRHLRDFDAVALTQREIRIGQHCFGCTAGSGSSCRGELT